MRVGGDAGRSPRRSSRYSARPCYDVRGTCVHVTLPRRGRCQPQFRVQVTQMGAARETGSEQEVIGEKNSRRAHVHGVCVCACVCVHGVHVHGVYVHMVCVCVVCVCMVCAHMVCVRAWCVCAWVCVCARSVCIGVCVCARCAWCVCVHVVCACAWCVCARVVCVFMVCTRVWMCVCTERTSPSNIGEYSSYMGTGGDVTSRAQDVVRGYSPAAPWTVWTSLWRGCEHRPI